MRAACKERRGEQGGSEFVPVPGGCGFQRIRLRIGDSDQSEAGLFTAKDAEDAKERPFAITSVWDKNSVSSQGCTSETYAVLG
jgi:hypothetical protein